jgi:hypothetical protein
MTTEFFLHKDFLPSLKTLSQKSVPFQRAGQRALDAWTRAQSGDCTHEQVFNGLQPTNHGENRVSHCVKYDLTGFARLITVYSNNVCIFLFVGDHTASDLWLDKNKGMDIVGRKDERIIRLAPVFVSDNRVGGHGLIASQIDLMSNGPVIDLLNKTYREKLLIGLDDDLVQDIRTIESHTDEGTVYEVADRIEGESQKYAVLDVLLALRSSDKIKAKNRIDQFFGAAKPLAQLSRDETGLIASSETIVRVEDVDPVLFEHFVRTANFKEWMLFLHPAQRSIVDKDFAGPTRLAGVSGSGKTCVVIHRAVRLAKADPAKQILVLTLNDALSKLIQELIQAQCGSALPANISIKSIFQLCFEKLVKLEPDKRDYYSRRTVARNAYVASEHIDEIWQEYFHCLNNNHDADKMFDVVRTLLVRKICPQDYLRQELDYIRSAFSPKERDRYLEMDRAGRVIPFETKYRRSVLGGLKGWETKMAAVGAIDDLGIVTALYRHLGSLQAEYHHTLVDEVQDLGTLELQIARKITHHGNNDLFLCGDAAQSVQTKHADLKSAGIELPSARSISLKQNYRNSSQILTAAHNVLSRSFEKIPTGTVDLEILAPEYANFSSPNPALLESEDVMREFSLALSYVSETQNQESGKKACIALCGYTQKAIEDLGREVKLPVLSDTSDIAEGHLFLSDLEQTKGFEFDLMIVLNCSSGVIPHPQLPEHEWFRDLCKLYVALTRAKVELIVSHSGVVSPFLADSMECFNVGKWSDYVALPQDLGVIQWPDAALNAVGNLEGWKVNGKDFLKMRDAVGLSASAQDAILSCVTGTEKVQRRAGGGPKQIEWKTFYDFFAGMQNEQNAVSVISKEVLGELKTHFSEHWNKSSLTSQASPQEALVENAQANVAQLKVFKHFKVSSYSPDTRSAYALAVLLVAQGVASVAQLAVGRQMPLDLLTFLLPEPAIKAWTDSGWLRPHRSTSEQYVLTKSGWDECLWRTGVGQSERKNSNILLRVDPSRVEAFRQTILNGPGVSNQTGNFTQRAFVISPQTVPVDQRPSLG